MSRPEFKMLKIDNSEKSAIKSGTWKNPGAKLYDQLLNAMYIEGNDVKNIDENSIQWYHYLQEAYLIAPVKQIKNSPHGITPYSRSGCKYPHHVVKGDKLVVSIPGIKAAYARAKQMGIYEGDVKDHIDRHYRELGLQKSDDVIEENFNFIYDYIHESLGISLYDETEEYLIEASHGQLKQDHRLVIDVNTRHYVHIIYSTKDMIITINNAEKSYIQKNGLSDESYLKRYGNTDHCSYNQKVLAIIDMKTGEKLQSVTCIGPSIGKKKPPVTVTVGEIDKIPSFKSTYWPKDTRGISDRVFAMLDATGTKGRSSVRGMIAARHDDMTSDNEYQSKLLALGDDEAQKYQEMMKKKWSPPSKRNKNHNESYDEITESLNWIEKFVHDEKFRESVDDNLKSMEINEFTTIFPSGWFDEYIDENNGTFTEDAEEQQGTETSSQSDQPVEQSKEDTHAEEPKEDSSEESTEEKPEKESEPKRVDKEESDKNGVRRKKLYIAFIEWCKEYNPKNTFGSIFDKDIFHVAYPFVPEEMRYFYRLANPILCVLAGHLTFFQVSELRSLNTKNSKLGEMMIFAATENDMRVFNRKDKKIYRAIDKDGVLTLQEVIGNTFDTYIQRLVNKGDILNAPLEDE